MVKVTAKCTVKKDSIETFKTITSQLIDVTRKENGCLSYELFQDLKEPTIFIFIETWETMEALEAHAKAGSESDLTPKLAATYEKKMELNLMSLIK